MKPVIFDASGIVDVMHLVREGLKNEGLVVGRNFTSIRETPQLTGMEFQNLCSEIGRMWTTDDELKCELEHQVPGFKGLVELRHDGLLGSRALPWHTDLSHHPSRPLPCRVLHPIELPPDGSAKTYWVSMKQVWKTLMQLYPADYRQFSCWHQPAYGTGWKGRYAPLIETDPWTGEEFLSYSPAFVKHFFKRGLVEVEQSEKDWLLNRIEGALAQTPVYQHEWAYGDIVFWNNRGTMHRRDRIEAGHSRRQWRVTFDLTW